MERAVVLRTRSRLVFACHSSSCRPPTSGGTGGSSSSGVKAGHGMGNAQGTMGKARYVREDGTPVSADYPGARPVGEASGGRRRHDAATSSWSGKAGFETPAKRAYGNNVEGRIWKSKWGGYEAKVSKSYETATTVGSTSLAINRDLKTESAARKWVDENGTRHAANK